MRIGTKGYRSRFFSWPERGLPAFAGTRHNEAGMKQLMRGLAGIVFFFVMVNGAFAGLIIDVDPVTPTTTSPVAVTVWEWFGDPGQDFVDATFIQIGDRISIDVIMQDLHAPGTFWIQILTPGGGTVHLGALAEGFYEVDATMRMIPWFGGPPVFFDSGIGSFHVVPEPATLGLLVIGSFVLVDRCWRRGSITTRVQAE